MNPTLELPKVENETAPPNDNNEPIFCFKESNTIVCGKIKYFSYDDIDNESTFEPFFGETDLFGF